MFKVSYNKSSFLVTLPVSLPVSLPALKSFSSYVMINGKKNCAEDIVPGEIFSFNTSVDLELNLEKGRYWILYFTKNNNNSEQKSIIKRVMSRFCQLNDCE